MRPKASASVSADPGAGGDGGPVGCRTGIRGRIRWCKKALVQELLLAELQRFVVEDKCQVVALLGMGGIGKSSLAIRLVETVNSHFDFLFWRDLRTSPPVERVIGDFLRFLSGQFPVDLPGDTESQITLLIDLMRKNRCIVILDNIEPILMGGESSGQYRVGYEAYGDLIFRLGNTNHQSCLILTSDHKSVCSCLQTRVF